MENFIKSLVYFCNFWKGFGPFLSAFYLILWMMQFLAHETFLEYDKVFGFLPRFFDSFIHTEIDLFAQEGTMGCVYASCAILLFTIFLMRCEGNILKLKLSNDKKNIEAKIIKQKTLKQEELYRQKPYIPNLVNFYGLLELKLTNNSAYAKELDLEKLKKEYSKMLVKKLQEKYLDVRFSGESKLFIVSNEFSIFDSFLKDIVKMFEIFQELGNEQMIKTQMLLSFECGSTNSNPKFIAKLLSQVNNFQNYNKIVVINKFIDKYRQNKVKHFEIISLGIAKVDIEVCNDMDIEIAILKRKKSI